MLEYTKPIATHLFNLKQWSSYCSCVEDYFLMIKAVWPYAQIIGKTLDLVGLVGSAVFWYRNKHIPKGTISRDQALYLFSKENRFIGFCADMVWYTRNSCSLLFKTVVQQKVILLLLFFNIINVLYLVVFLTELHVIRFMQVLKPKWWGQKFIYSY